ncbi:hypothetical protein [uncultured Kiloniella sp.]|uniref:hypothetical protein n=1 Tax=uncultured Kiloniella sp. TaxID=1133091 RepID=UPI0026164631|nr:hypothetical protein [uncultured Kiloniella sp.]
MGRFAWQFSLLLSVMLIASLLPRELEAGGGPPCQQPIASRYCSSTQLNMLVPQKGRAKVFLEQLIRGYRPELLESIDGSDDELEISKGIRDFHKTYRIEELTSKELGAFVRKENEEFFAKGDYLTQAYCYSGGNFSNLHSYYMGLKSSDLGQDEIRHLAMMRLALVQDCLFNLDDYLKTSQTFQGHVRKEQGLYKNWSQYIEAAAFYHDGFFPEAAELFAMIALEEKNEGRETGWLIETARYMEVLALFHNGREGQEKVFLPAIFNSFTEAFLTDFPQSEYRRHVEDMEIGIWLHYGDRDRYYTKLLDEIAGKQLLTSDDDQTDQLDHLAINALRSNIDEIAIRPLKHRNGITLLASLLSKSQDASKSEELEGLCSQIEMVTSGEYDEIETYSEMVCDYLLKGKEPSSNAYKNTPLYSHAQAFVAVVNLEGGKFESAGMQINDIAVGNATSLEDLFALRSKQLEVRLKDKTPLAFILEDAIQNDNFNDDGQFSELTILDTVLYEQISRYFLSTNDFISALSGTDNPLLKFALIRPHLDEAMIQEDWQGAALLSKRLDWEAVLKAGALDKSSKLRDEVQLYADLEQDLETLSLGQYRGRERAKALSDVAYFLYKNHIAPRCSYARSKLINRYLENCQPVYVHLAGEGVWAENKTTDQPRSPIEMFTEALDLYGKEKETIAEQARLLRIMIFCAKGAKNVSYCLRWKNIPKKQFQNWFETLAVKYPKSERVKYWYYDLPFYSGVYTNSDGEKLDQEYWYEEDAYLGYLDGGPYGLSTH